MEIVIYAVLAVWAVGAVFGVSHLFYIEEGLVRTGEKDRWGFDTYKPAEKVPAYRWARTILWPVTMVLLIPLLIWIVIKFIWSFFVGVFEIYKEKM